MFFRKKNLKADVNLSDVVKKEHNTGHVFIDINNDLGESAEQIMRSSPIVQMAYGYARRCAAAAMHIQGLVDKETYDHVISIFKSLQVTTKQSDEFQEAAFEGAVNFMLEYSHLISGYMVKKIISVAENYDLPPGQLNDQQLFHKLLETAYNEQPKTQESSQHSQAVPRIINYVEQSHSFALGPFADMLEDVKKAAEQRVVLRNPLLSAAISYSLDLSSSALWVAGGVNPKLLQDIDRAIVGFRGDIGSDKQLHTEALEQAVELANVYVPGVTLTQALVIIMLAEQGERLMQNGEGILDVDEIMHRANQLDPDFM